MRGSAKDRVQRMQRRVVPAASSEPSPHGVGLEFRCAFVPLSGLTGRVSGVEGRPAREIDWVRNGAAA